MGTCNSFRYHLNILIHKILKKYRKSSEHFSYMANRFMTFPRYSYLHRTESSEKFPVSAFLQESRFRTAPRKDPGPTMGTPYRLWSKFVKRADSENFFSETIFMCADDNYFTRNSSVLCAVEPHYGNKSVLLPPLCFYGPSREIDYFFR